jgi:hypothetical protein
MRLGPHLGLVVNLLAGAAVAAEVAFIATQGIGGDAHAYWAADLAHPYRHSTANTLDAYLYSPAFLQAIAPLRLLPFAWFFAIVVIAEAATAIWLAGPVVVAIALLPTPWSPVFTDVWFGNISVLIAGVVALGLRRPAAWSFVLLTKVTPGVGILWFAGRRDWRALLLVAIATLAIVVVSIGLGGIQPWSDWLANLNANAALPAPDRAIHLPPLGIRLVLAAAIALVAGWQKWPAAVPVVVILSVPVFWFGSLSLLLVWFRQLRDRARQHAEHDEGHVVDEQAG